MILLTMIRVTISRKESHSGFYDLQVPKSPYFGNVFQVIENDAQLWSDPQLEQNHKCQMSYSRPVNIIRFPYY